MNGRRRSPAVAWASTDLRTAPLPREGEGPRRGAPAPRGRRSLAGYLLVPRPGDAVKGLLVPVAFGLGALGVGSLDREAVVRAAVVWGALELLVYPARYQWNDVRGFAADQRHPGERDRGRLPGPLSRARRNVAASVAAALARLAAVACLPLLLPGLHLGGVLAATTAAVFGVAAVYEALRARCTGRTGHVPPAPGPGLVALWVVVGAGYAVRGTAGLAMAVDLGGHPGAAVAAVVALWAFGIAFVTGRWALEATAFARVDRGRLVWAARADQAREHLLGLVRWLPSPPAGQDPADWAALRGRTPPAAPWNLALVVSAAAAALTGRLLTGPAPAAHAVVAAVVGGVAALGAVLVPRGRVAVVLAGAAVQLAVLVAAGAPRPPAAVLPWVAVMAAYLVFSAGSRSTVGAPTRLARSAAAAALAPVARAVVGRATWQVLRGAERRGPR
ncbi:hypothetical protein [Saccharothrix syringae]|uniref:Uncharacterized protein n=1 Tax=Saccharothrix syringae TaxID=103733 RepID=A0A5Q0GY15_SACSY|nr:hypothetical protein [Saccharothrix syringae]QFZ18374.1 hypothetical protein EKG83_13565 [Saccharothrix syringae]